jgi:hypothetical protein
MSLQNESHDPQDSATPKRRVFRTPFSQRALSLVGLFFTLAATCALILAAAAVFAADGRLGLFIAAVAVFTAALAGYVFRDLRGKLGLRVTLDEAEAVFELPSGRSLIHRPPAQHLVIPYAEMQAIEARFEGYRSLGMALMQRAYALRKTSGELIFLFEERALATGFATSVFTELVAELLARAKIPLRELGTVEGRGALLCVWGTEAPDWAAPPLPRDQALRLWRHAAGTGALAMTLIILLVVLRFGFGHG